MTDEKLNRANEIDYIIKGINDLYGKFIILKSGTGNRIEFSYNFMHEEDLRKGLFDAGIKYLKEQLEKYKKEFEEL